MADIDSVMKQIESGSRLIYLGKCVEKLRVGYGTGGEFIINPEQIVYVEKGRDVMTNRVKTLAIRMPNAMFVLYENGHCEVYLPELLQSSNE